MLLERGRLVDAVAFLLGVGVILAYALPGGAYDIVVRQEYGVVAWAILSVGVVCGVLPRGGLGPRVRLVLAAFAAYAAWTALSLIWTESSERTLAEIVRVLDYAGLFVLVAAVSDERTWMPAARGVHFGTVLVCLLALGSRLLPGVLGADQVQRALQLDRLSYPFGYWNAVGAWAAMSAALGLAWSAHDRSRAGRAAALAGVPVAIVTAYLTYSRAGLIGVAIAIVAVVWLGRHRLTAGAHAAVALALAGVAILAIRWEPEIARGTGSAGAGVVIALVALGMAGAACGALATAAGGIDRRRLPARLVRRGLIAATLPLVVGAAIWGPGVAQRAWHDFRRPSVARGSDPSARLANLTGARYGIWGDALSAFEHRPLTGIGAGTFEFWWNRHPKSSEFVRDAHSLELANMAELGVPGIVLIVALMTAAVRVLIAARGHAADSLQIGAASALLGAFAVYLVAASVDWMWQSTAVSVLALTAAALASAGPAGGGRHASAAAGRTSSAARRRSRASRAMIAAGCVVAAAVQLPGIVGTAELRQSQSEAAKGRPALALVWARRAVAAEPWAASPHLQRGLVLESLGRLPAAAADLRRAVANERTNYENWLILSRIETERGRIAAAESAYATARRLRPNALVFSYGPYFRR